MNLLSKFLLIVPVAFSITLGQMRDYRTHTRGMLWETVFNTGEIGRTYDVGISGTLPEYRSWDWPGNGGFRIGDEKFDGFYNAFGGGMWIGADTGRWGNRKFYISPTGGAVHCGMVTDDNGRTTAVENVYSYPISIKRETNFPLNADGSINPSYNPNEAEEIITASWDTPIGVTVTRTSRAWSFPDYDDFIIYEYEMENTGRRLTVGASHDTLYEMTVSFGYANTPSYVAYWREYGRWHYGDSKNGQMYSRLDMKRWLWYTHTRNGKPDKDYYSQWANTGEHGGGLTAPASVGFMMLNYDHAHLMKFRESPRTQFYVNATGGINDHRYVWDKGTPSPLGGIVPTNDARIKQPWMLRMENSHMPAPGRYSWLDGKTARKTSPHIPGRLDLKGQTAQDTGRITSYWFGRANMVVTQAYTQACAKISTYGPYFLPPGEKIRFALAEVAGYGPGIETDSVYYDYGGGTGDSPNEGGPYFHPVPSWYNTMWYPLLNTDPALTMGSTYLKNNPLPAFVNSSVISMRQVADRAIQMYKGGPVIKYDSVQYDPLHSPSLGLYTAQSIPCPSPVITVRGEGPILSQITWAAHVESITRSTAGFAKLHAPLHHYQVLRSVSPIGPWTVLDSLVIRGDSRFFNTEGKMYTYNDHTAHLNTLYYYAVVSIDSLSAKGGLTNITKHNAQYSAVKKMSKVYAAPNPFLVNSGYQDNADKIGIYGLPSRATIRVYSYSGQLVQTLEHDASSYSTAWLQISRNNQWIASGIYFFTVEDRTTGDKAWGKFIVIH